MSGDIKITMLGATASGKTTYMLGMYAVMQIGIRGLTLSAVDLDDDIRLTDQWERLNELTGGDRWPRTTTEPHEYKFTLSYAFKPIIQFDWFDYRGGAVYDLQNETDVPALIGNLSQAHCVFLCVSGEHLREPVTLERRAVIDRTARIGRLNRFMKELGARVSPSSQKPFPVAIVLTKYDLCRHRSRDEVIADVKELFPSLFVENGGWLTSIFPVSLGTELAKDAANAPIQPLNVHLPIAFAIYARFRDEMIARRYSHAQASNELQNIQSGNWLTRVWNSDKIANSQQRMRQLSNEMNAIQENMTRLTNELSKATIFLDGKEVQVAI